MTPEGALWYAVKPALEALGKPVRLENAAAASVPDVALICPTCTLWIELKIARGNRIRMPKFQHIFAREIAAVSPGYVWLLVTYGNKLVAVQYTTIKTVEASKNEKYVEYDLRNSPIHEIGKGSLEKFFFSVLKGEVM